MTDALLHSAVSMEQAGNLAEAGRLYREILNRNPRHFQALYQLAYLDFGSGRYDAAATLFAEAADINPHAADVHFAHGCALQRVGRHEAAVSAFDKAIALDPHHSDALVNRAVAEIELKRLADAACSFQAALAVAPARAELWLAHGDVLAAMGRLEDSLASYGKALAIRPGFMEALNNRGTALFSLKRYDEAIASYDALLATAPRNRMALLNRGIALLQAKRFSEALANFDAVVALDPSNADALYRRSTALLGLQRYTEVLTCLDRALAADPRNAQALVVRGIALKELGRLDEALASYGRALSVKPDCVDALVNREVLLFRLKRYEEAADDCTRALALDPEAPYVRGDRHYYRLQCCDWRDAADEEGAIAARLEQGRRVIQPFMNVALRGSAASQLQCARIWAAGEYPRAEPLWRGRRYRHDRIRIAYLSGDFCEHPVLRLMAHVFERHDRTHFETIAISLGADDGSSLRKRAMGAFDRFIDASGKNDLQVAQLMAGLEADIVVDLMGFTGASRHGILVHRPAPVQAQFLGFPGSMGTKSIDYILADRIAIPESHRSHYDEHIVYLPDCYMPHDAKRNAPTQTVTRAAAGLPADGFVFCSFNNSYKFSAPMFDIWMRLLRAVEGSVLWLPENNPSATRNLRREAGARGVAPERLIFAPFAPSEADHLARLQLADLFLDTLPFNAHTTAMDALWAGVPVLTMLGDTFAGRVAASLNHAAGMPEMVMHSPSEYEALALRLAAEPARLAAIRAKLARNRTSCVLFDTARFTRGLESAYETMWRRAEQNLPPGAFAVEAS